MEKSAYTYTVETHKVLNFQKKISSMQISSCLGAILYA